VNETQKKIHELRKELREDYERLCKKYWDVFIEIDNYFESLSKGLDRKEEK